MCNRIVRLLQLYPGKTGANALRLICSVANVSAIGLTSARAVRLSLQPEPLFRWRIDYITEISVG